MKDAENRAGESFVDIERNLRKIARNRRALDEKLERIRNTDRTLESITDRYQKELQEIKSMKKEILEQAQKEAAEIIRGANRQVENTIRTIREAEAEKEITQEARKELQNFVSVLARKKEQELTPAGRGRGCGKRRRPTRRHARKWSSSGRSRRGSRHSGTPR